MHLSFKRSFMPFRNHIPVFFFVGFLFLWLIADINAFVFVVSISKHILFGVPTVNLSQLLSRLSTVVVWLGLAGLFLTASLL